MARLPFLPREQKFFDLFEESTKNIVKAAQALKEMGGKYVLPFSFKNESGKRTSHNLVFVSKAFSTLPVELLQKKQRFLG